MSRWTFKLTGQCYGIHAGRYYCTYGELTHIEMLYCEKNKLELLLVKNREWVEKMQKLTDDERDQELILVLLGGGDV